MLADVRSDQQNRKKRRNLLRKDGTIILQQDSCYQGQKIQNLTIPENYTSLLSSQDQDDVGDYRLYDDDVVSPLQHREQVSSRFGRGSFWQSTIAPRPDLEDHDYEEDGHDNVDRGDASHLRTFIPSDDTLETTVRSSPFLKGRSSGSLPSKSYFPITFSTRFGAGLNVLHIKIALYIYLKIF